MFPNETQLDQIKLIEIAEAGAFIQFDDDLSSSGYSEDRSDFVFTIAGSKLIARPKNHSQMKVWGYDISTRSDWVEDVTVDQQGNLLQNGAIAPATNQATTGNIAAGSISASDVSTKKQVVIPDGIGKSSEDSFFALLDEAIAVGESET